MMTKNKTKRMMMMVLQRACFLEESATMQTSTRTLVKLARCAMGLVNVRGIAVAGGRKDGAEPGKAGSADRETDRNRRQDRRPRA
eukprot:1160428-Rhodomonas_salina.1